MTILITGGTGKTGLKLAHLLSKAGHAVLLTSRKGEVPQPFKGVKFDWLEPSTFTNPFDADPAIDRVYVVGPIGVLDTLPHVKPFIDLAVTKGVKRFVVLSGSPVGKGGPVAGKVHEYLEEIGVDYAVLRPTWFMGMHRTTFMWRELMRCPNRKLFYRICCAYSCTQPDRLSCEGWTARVRCGRRHCQGCVGCFTR
jgi:uncharacterized protein YbjT (DUF2867 family)